MSTDRELLEAAARADGLRARFFESHAPGLKLFGEDKAWNPLADDGDALRLAVKLGLIINFSTRADCRGMTVVSTNGLDKFGEPCHDGREGAARRAIVRAAASMAPKEGSDA